MKDLAATREEERRKRREYIGYLQCKRWLDVASPRYERAIAENDQHTINDLGLAVKSAKEAVAEYELLNPPKAANPVTRDDKGGLNEH